MTINYTKLAAAVRKGMKGTRKGRKRRTWEQRNYPRSRYYKMYHERTPQSAAAFGPSYARATDEQREMRKHFNMTGRGRYHYKSFRRGVAGAARHLGKLAAPGASIAMLAGQPELAAGIMGAGAAANIVAGRGMYLGRGSYEPSVESNVVVEGGGGVGVPTFGSIGDETGGLTVSHSEFISDIYALPWANGSPVTNFQNTPFLINPGLTRLFPFLSQIAANFEEYEMVQMMLTYVPKLSPNLSSTDGQVGSVLMYTDYNPNDSTKTSKQQMMQAYGTSTGRIIDQVVHGVECDPSKLKGDGHKFIRVRGVGDKDLNDYDAGKFQIAVMSTPEELSNQVIGELHVSYTVLLRKPRVYSLYGFSLDKSAYSATIPTNAVGSVHPWKEGAYNSIDCEVTGTVGGYVQVKFPASFAGTVKLTMCHATTSGLDFGGAASQFFAALTGNVTRVQGLLDPSALPVSDRLTPHQTVDPCNRTLWESVARIEQAESGVDNTIRLYLRSTNNEQVVHLQVERFNNFELDTLEPYETP